MLSQILAATRLVVLLGCAIPVVAQVETEPYVPIGQSPGVSGVSSYIGQIEEVDSAALRITVRGDQGARAYQLTDETRIWLDRTSQRQTNLVGTYSDCAVGRRVEVKYTNAEATTADWVKVEISPPD